jgi:hypothetical protein
MTGESEPGILCRVCTKNRTLGISTECLMNRIGSFSYPTLVALTNNLYEISRSQNFFQVIKFLRDVQFLIRKKEASQYLCRLGGSER